MIPHDNDIKRALLMELYAQKNHCARPQAAYGLVNDYFEKDLEDEDFTKYRNSQSKWANRVQFARLHLANEGLILTAKQHKHNEWKLSGEGIKKGRKLFIEAYGEEEDPWKDNLEVATENFINNFQEENFTEGGKKQRFSSYYERKPKIRLKALQHHGVVCKACGFDFKKTYGEIGEAFIEVHHLKPVSSFSEEHLVNPITDMTVLCANCHRMIHKINDSPTLEKLIDILRKNKDN